MKEKDFNVSTELAEFFKEATRITKENNLSVVTIESFILSVIKKYLNNPETSLECLSFKRILDRLTTENKKRVLDICSKDFGGLSFWLPDSLKKPNSIPFSDDLYNSLVSAKEGMESATKVSKTDMFGSKGGNRLGTLELLISILNLSASNKVVMHLEPFINGTDLLKQIMMDGVENKPILNPSIVGTERETPDAGLMDYLKMNPESRIIDGTDSEIEEILDEDTSGEQHSMSASTGSISSREAKPDSKTPTLDQFATDMTQNAKDGLYDPVVGREKELQELIQILCCRKKNNAILLGDPGCGKTALVECLAQKLANNDVPRELKGHRIMSLSSTDLLSGTIYRGQAEERVVKLCKELKENRDIILYMDEFHQSTSENQTSIADMLKPALGRGELTMIASTTLAEFKKYVEKDGALKRRFQRVLIEEPKLEETFNILKSLSTKYSKFHHVRYSDEVLRACAELADKFVYDKKSPDKAIDLMDTAGSRTKLSTTLSREAIESKEKEISELTNKKIEFVIEDRFEEAAKVRDELIVKKEELDKMNHDFDNDDSGWPEVTLDCVSKVISDLTNIPSEIIRNPEIAKLRGMKENLLKKVIGQDESIKSVSLALSKSYLGLRDETKPIANLLFVGPTGVGKTLLCEEICKTIYGDEKALLRIDCGEYSQAHTVTKLIGAPASYVGYGEPGIFDSIRERPNSLVLFDEIEKMHPDIINTIFLNIMSTGMVKMNNGVDVSFKNCIVVFTGNVGTKELQLNGNGLGFTAPGKEEKKKINHDIVMKAIKKQFRPEFINRLTGITVFNELDLDDMDKIFDLELAKLQERLEKKGYTLKVTDELKKLIISETDTKYGARDLSRGISKYVEDRICETMLEEDTTGKTIIKVTKKEKESLATFTA